MKLDISHFLAAAEGKNSAVLREIRLFVRDRAGVVGFQSTLKPKSGSAVPFTAKDSDFYSSAASLSIL